MGGENLLQLVDNERCQFEKDYRVTNSSIKKKKHLHIDNLWRIPKIKKWKNKIC